MAELVVVMALLAITIGFSLISLKDFTQQKKVEEVAGDLFNTIKVEQSAAKAVVNPQICGGATFLGWYADFYSGAIVYSPPIWEIWVWGPACNVGGTITFPNQKTVLMPKGYRSIFYVECPPGDPSNPSTSGCNLPIFSIETYAICFSQPTGKARGIFEVWGSGAEKQELFKECFGVLTTPDPQVGTKIPIIKDYVVNPRFYQVICAKPIGVITKLKKATDPC